MKVARKQWFFLSERSMTTFSSIVGELGFGFSSRSVTRSRGVIGLLDPFKHRTQQGKALSTVFDPLRASYRFPRQLSQVYASRDDVW